MHNFDFVKPSSVADAVRALSAEGAQALSGGQTLLPAEITTAPELPPAAPFSSRNAPKEEEDEEQIDVNSVFAKLKQLKPSE